METRWIVRRDGKASAPLTSAQLKKAAAEGKVLPTDEVQKEGMGRFVPAGKVRGLLPSTTGTHTPEAGPRTEVEAAAGTEAGGGGRLTRVLAGVVGLVVVMAVGLVVMLRGGQEKRAAVETVAVPSVVVVEGGETVVKVDEPAEEDGGEKVAVEETSSHKVKAKGGFTADERALIRLASRYAPKVRGFTPGVGFVYEPEDPPRVSGKARDQLLAREVLAGGRGSRLALRYLVCEVLFQSMNEGAAEFERQFAAYPAAVLELAAQSARLALRGEDVPPPFSKDFRDLTRTSTAWVDGMRKNKALEAELRLELEKAYYDVNVALAEDLMPALGDQPMATEVFRVRQGPYGQSLALKYEGAEPLTNVVLLSIVTPKRVPDGSSRGLVDLFNRGFGSTDEQAEDAQRILKATDDYLGMSKYSSKFIPRLAPGDVVDFVVGEMMRGKPYDGNANTLEIHCDQGRIDRVGIEAFPSLAAPERRSRVEGRNQEVELTLDEGGSVDVSGRFTREDRMTTLKRVEHASKTFLIALVEGSSYSISFGTRRSKAPPEMRVYGPEGTGYPDITWTKSGGSTTTGTVAARSGTYRIECYCPTANLGEFTLKIRRRTTPRGKAVRRASEGEAAAGRRFAVLIWVAYAGLIDAAVGFLGLHEVA